MKAFYVITITLYGLASYHQKGWFDFLGLLTIAWLAIPMLMIPKK